MKFSSEETQYREHTIRSGVHKVHIIKKCIKKTQEKTM
jgi:hypothetical protein